MKATEIRSKLIDGYLEMLNSLDRDCKLELISRLSKSMRSEQDINNTPFEQAFGAWDKEDEAEAIIDEIRSSRTTNRKIVDL